MTCLKLSNSNFVIKKERIYPGVFAKATPTQADYTNYTKKKKSFSHGITQIITDKKEENLATEHTEYTEKKKENP
ncbi:hypothetical protein JEZ13_03945 [bacterium]|nr:hypothetical protein [bacterium]